MEKYIGMVEFCLNVDEGGDTQEEGAEYFYCEIMHLGNKLQSGSLCNAGFKNGDHAMVIDDDFSFDENLQAFIEQIETAEREKYALSLINAA